MPRQESSALPGVRSAGARKPDASRRVIYAGIAGNSLIAICKLVAAVLTHSSAMLSEAVHSLVDTSNQLLMLYGLRRSERPPDTSHPLGHGRELYFWSFVVSLLIFAIGAGVSIYQGVRHVIAPVEIEHPYVNYIVLGLAAVFEGGSWLVALREFRADKGELGYLEAAQESKDPAIFMLLFEDSAALTGILLAFAGTGAAQALDLPVLDGVASIAIGVLLAAVAGFLARESKDLLMGERAHVELESSICRMAREEAGIEHANSILTVHLGPRQVVAALSLDFADTLSAAEVKAAVARLEARIRRAHPEVVMVLVKPQDVEDFRAWKGRRRRSRPHSQSGQGRPFSRRNAGFQSLER